MKWSSCARLQWSPLWWDHVTKEHHWQLYCLLLMNHLMTVLGIHLTSPQLKLDHKKENTLYSPLLESRSIGVTFRYASNASLCVWAVCMHACIDTGWWFGFSSSPLWSWEQPYITIVKKTTMSSSWVSTPFTFSMPQLLLSEQHKLETAD